MKIQLAFSTLGNGNTFNGSIGNPIVAYEQTRNHGFYTISNININNTT
jgi:hypothetical protein